MFGKYCYEGGQKHNFEPRYSRFTGPVCIPGEVEIEGRGSFVQVLERFRGERETYQGDVCSWCGEVINAQPLPDPDPAE